ncbi:MAG: hypothetical protein KC561_07120, partial [Myxococcales bacterium]|nr:hypothetical protein [Myxococcales bacterium]
RLQTEVFTWWGPGLFAQEFAALLFPLAIGATNRSAITGRWLGTSAILMAGLWLSHLLLGYAACLLCGLALVRPEARSVRVRVGLRLAATYLLTAAAALYLLLPTLLESRIVNRTIWEDSVYWDGFGWATPLKALLSGQLFDRGRIPLLSILVAIGLLVSLVWIGIRLARRLKDQGQGQPDAPQRSPQLNEFGAGLFLILAFVLSYALMAGRAAWGGVADVLPFARSLPFHRFFCSFHLAGLWLAGIGLGRLLHLLGWWRTALRSGVALLGLCAVIWVLSPPVVQQNERVHEAYQHSGDALRADSDGIQAAMRYIRDTGLADSYRAYAGTSWDWGRQRTVGVAPWYSFWSRYGISAIAYMYHTMSLNSDIETEFSPDEPADHRLFNIRWLILPENWRAYPRTEQVFTSGRVAVYETNANGFFDIVGVDRYFDAAGATSDDFYRFRRDYADSAYPSSRRGVRIGWSENDHVADGESVVTSSDPLSHPRLEGWRPPGGIVVESGPDGFDAYRAQVQTADESYVLFRQTYHPRWLATVDGEPTETVMLAPSYVGVRVAPGTHEVRLAYRPESRSTLMFWLGVGLLFSVLVLERYWVYRVERGENHSEIPAW